MLQVIEEFVSSRGLDVRVDAEAGVIRGVKVLGLSSRNGRRYLPEALIAAVGLYEGAKVNVNHPKGHPQSPRDYQDRIGVIRNIAFREGEGLFGDLHYNPQHALAGQLAWDAAHAPENVGFSHNVEARVVPRAEHLVVEAIHKVQSVDLVADPATTRGLFESQRGDQSDVSAGEFWQRLTVVELEARRPDIVAAIAASSREQAARLREQLEELSVRETRRAKETVARRLLAEHGLPAPDAGELARQLVGGGFWESLVVAADEPAMRRLVAERAQLLKAAERCAACSAQGQPRSREQRLVEVSATPRDCRSFVHAIT